MIDFTSSPADIDTVYRSIPASLSLAGDNVCGNVRRTHQVSRLVSDCPFVEDPVLGIILLCDLGGVQPCHRARIQIGKL